jgi:hypothetical protein
MALNGSIDLAITFFPDLFRGPGNQPEVFRARHLVLWVKAILLLQLRPPAVRILESFDVRWLHTLARIIAANPVIPMPMQTMAAGKVLFRSFSMWRSFIAQAHPKVSVPTAALMATTMMGWLSI